MFPFPEPPQPASPAVAPVTSSWRTRLLGAADFAVALLTLESYGVEDLRRRSVSVGASMTPAMSTRAGAEPLVASDTSVSASAAVDVTAGPGVHRRPGGASRRRSGAVPRDQRCLSPIKTDGTRPRAGAGLGAG